MLDHRFEGIIPGIRGKQCKLALIITMYHPKYADAEILSAISYNTSCSDGLIVCLPRCYSFGSIRCSQQRQN